MSPWHWPHGDVSITGDPTPYRADVEELTTRLREVGELVGIPASRPRSRLHRRVHLPCRTKLALADAHENQCSGDSCASHRRVAPRNQLRSGSIERHDALAAVVLAQGHFGCGGFALAHNGEEGDAGIMQASTIARDSVWLPGPKDARSPCRCSASRIVLA